MSNFAYLVASQRISSSRQDGMSIEQAFVSGVAFALGAVCVVVAIFDLPWFFRLPKARWVERRWGRHGARWAFGLIGLLLVLLGLYIAFGSRPIPPWGSTPRSAAWHGGKNP